MNDNPKLYCGTYAKYNNGSIKGKWMDLTEYETAEDFMQACRELHKDEDDPEFMFQDFECFPESMYGEAMWGKELERLIEFAQLGEDEREYIEEYLEEVDSNADFDDIRENYLGLLDERGYKNSAEAYGYRCVEEGMLEIPESVTGYFDYESYGRNMLEGICLTESGHMFSQ